MDQAGSFDPVASMLNESEMACVANKFFLSSSPQQLSSFMQCALSIILGHALPNIRDGMKPVH